jgi:hypothetical protein
MSGNGLALRPWMKRHSEHRCSVSCQLTSLFSTNRPGFSEHRGPVVPPGWESGAPPSRYLLTAPLRRSGASRIGCYSSCARQPRDICQGTGSVVPVLHRRGVVHGRGRDIDGSSRLLFWTGAIGGPVPFGFVPEKADRRLGRVAAHPRPRLGSQPYQPPCGRRIRRCLGLTSGVDLIETVNS